MSAAEVVAATEVAEVTIQGQPSLLHDEVAELPTITPEPVSSEPAPVAELPVAAPAVAPIEPTAVAALPTEAPVPTPIPQAVEEPGIDVDALVEQAPWPAPWAILRMLGCKNKSRF